MTYHFDVDQDDRLITAMAMMEAIIDGWQPLWCQMREGYGIMETRDQVKYNVDAIRDILGHVEEIHADAYDTFWRRDGIDLWAWDYEIIPFLMRHFFIRRLSLTRDDYRMVIVNPDWKDMIGFLDLNGTVAFQQRYPLPNFQ